MQPNSKTVTGQARAELAKLVPIGSLIDFIRSDIQYFGLDAWARVTGVELKEPQGPAEFQEGLGAVFDYVIDLQFLYADRFIARMEKDEAVEVAASSVAGEIGSRSMSDLYQKLMDWSCFQFRDAKFRGPAGPLEHLKKELNEVLEARSQAHVQMEIVDCFFFVLDAAWRAGVSLTNLVGSSLNGPPESVIQSRYEVSEVAALQHLANRPVGARERLEIYVGQVNSCVDEVLRNGCGNVSVLRNMFLNVFAAAHTMHAPYGGFLDLCYRKLAINKTRKWPPPTATGIIEHIKDDNGET